MSKSPTSGQLPRSLDYALRFALIAGGTTFGAVIAALLLHWAGVV